MDKLDRRVRRTRQLLRDALMALITEKGYDAITVQDITDRADVARTTFYLHYRDKDELLFSSMTEMYEALIARMETTDAYRMDDPADFEHVAEHAAFYKVMLSERGSMTFMVRIMDFLAMVMQQQVLGDKTTTMPPDLIAHVIAGAQVGIIRWWLQNDMQPPPETIAKMGSDLFLNGLKAYVK